MFPLGSTVFPQQVVPLHVFEPRYQTLLEHLTTRGASPTFGIVLIERGFEVGGGDSRTRVGTRVEIQHAERFEDGRWAVITAGIERIDIVDWLPDDPYPRATVHVRQVRDNGGGDLAALEELVLTTIDLAIGEAGERDFERPNFSSDPQAKLDQLSALSPISDFDRQNVLEAPGTSEQIQRLTEALETKQILLRAQLGHGEDFG